MICKYVNVILISLGFLCVLSSGCTAGIKEEEGGDDMRELKVSAIPNDPLFNTQYYFHTMEVLKAWEFGKGSSDCLIGVLERGVDAQQPELKKSILEVYELDGMEHPTYGRFKTHGTIVAGIIAAEANNEIGIVGLAPDCKVAFASIGTHKFKKGTKEERRKWNKLFGAKAGEGMRYLVDKGCKVINCSFAYYSVPKDAFEYAVKNDVVVVVGSGNGNREVPKYLPDEVLVVGGVDKNDKRWKDGAIRSIINGFHTLGSNYGESLSVVAPICELTTCYPTDEETSQYLRDHDISNLRKNKEIQKLLFRRDSGWGTSWAAPMTTSLVALIRSYRPDLDANSVIEIVKKGADDLGKEGWDKYTGYGRLNFYNSLKLAESWPRH